MKIKEKLQAINFYYDQNRRAGHTMAMLNGAKNTDRVAIIWPNSRSARIGLVMAPDARHGSLESLEKLRGTKLPLLLDHTAIQTLLAEALAEIVTLENVIASREAV